MNKRTRLLECPFCGAFEVDRLYLGTVQIDTCTCSACGARWDQDSKTGEYRGRGGLQSVVVPRDRGASPPGVA